jgi:predicted nucleic acid-binding protein
MLAGYLRRRSLTFGQVCSLQAEAEDLLGGSEFEVDSKAMLELARDSDCAACDCEFVALAKRLQVSLVTLDAKRLKAFPQHAVSLTAG